MHAFCAPQICPLSHFEDLHTHVTQRPPHLYHIHNKTDMLVRASLKLTGWGGPDNNCNNAGAGTHDQQQRPLKHLTTLSIPEASEGTTAASTPTPFLPGGMPLLLPQDGNSPPPMFASPATTCPVCHKTASSAAAAAEGVARGSVAACAACVGRFVGVGVGSGSSKRVRMVQVLPPSLVGRAHVWGNKLAIKSNWVCVDAPYFEAPGGFVAVVWLVLLLCGGAGLRGCELSTLARIHGCISVGLANMWSC